VKHAVHLAVEPARRSGRLHIQIRLKPIMLRLSVIICSGSIRGRLEYRHARRRRFGRSPGGMKSAAP